MADMKLRPLGDRVVIEPLEEDQMTASGIVMRTAVSEIRIIGRGTKGVRIMRLDEHDRVVGIAVVPPDIDNGDSGEPETGEPGEAERGQPGNG